MGRPTKVMYEYQIEWYATLADGVETTHDTYQPVCSDCSDYCVLTSAYRLNGSAINPRSGRSIHMGEKLTDADVNC